MFCPDRLPEWALWAPVLGGFLLSQLCGWTLYALHRNGRIELERFGFRINKLPIIFPLSVGTSEKRLTRLIVLIYRLSVAIFLMSFVASCMISFPRANCVDGTESAYPNRTFNIS